MPALLTFAQQNAIRAIVKTGEAKWLEAMVYVEDVRLGQELGNELLAQALRKAPETYEHILAAFDYTDRQGNVVDCKGLRYILAYWAYAEYSRVSRVHDTYSGQMAKRPMQAEHIGRGELENYANMQEQIAGAHMKRLRQYLAQESNNPLYYNITATVNSAANRGPRLRGIRKTR